MKEKRMIISIGRECGCGAYEIGQKLAAYFGIKLYDRNILDLVAERMHQDPAKLAKLEERVAWHLLPVQQNGFGVETNEILGKISKYDQLYLQEKSLIKQLAAKESFVIIGRAANAILSDDPNTLRVFVYASDSFKLPRVKAQYHLDSDQKALRKMRQVDKVRREYFEYYSHLTWGSGDAHDFMIDSSVFGINGTVQTIISMADRKFSQKPAVPDEGVQPESVPAEDRLWQPAIQPASL